LLRMTIGAAHRGHAGDVVAGDSGVNDGSILTIRAGD